MPPEFPRLRAQAVDEVETQVVKARFPRRLHCFNGIPRGVDAADGAQFAVVGGLHPQRDPIEPGSAQCPQCGDVSGALGIRLEGDLRVRRNGKAVKHCFQQSAEPICAEKARRAAAEVDRVDGVSRCFRRGGAQ